MDDIIINCSKGIEEWVNTQAGDNASPSEKGYAFCGWVLENVFEMSSNEALDSQATAGAKDHGIDAIRKSEGSVDVIQTKYGTSHDISELLKFHYDMMRIKSGKVISSLTANDEAQRAIAELQDAYDDEGDVKFYYVTNARFTEADRQKASELEGYKIDFFIKDLIDVAKEIDERQQEIPDTIKGRWFTLSISNGQIFNLDSTAVIAVSLNNIYQLVEAGDKDLFASNVRNYLRKTKINKEIVNTIKESPADFWLYNNGITIVCDDFEEKNYELRLQTPQIVNGCQTARSIWDVFSKKTKDSRDSIRGHVLVV